MTWGASLMRLPKGSTIAEIAEEHGNDWKPPPVGSVTDIGDALKSLFPDAEHHDDESVIHEGHAYVRFNYRDSTGSVQSIGVVSNGDEDSIPIIQAVCERLDLRMFDHQSGEIADFEQEPKRSMKEYRAFRDRALRKGERDEPSGPWTVTIRRAN
jgi:hypothetical protein